MEPQASNGPGRYAHLLWNTPLSATHASDLLTLLRLDAARDLVDLGCGWGELLLRAMERVPAPSALRAVGVDNDATLVEHATAAARDRGLSARVSFVLAHADSWTDESDRVFCIGAAHAFGGSEAALRALLPRVRPGELLLYGDGCWEGAASKATRAMFPQVLPLDSIVASARAMGWHVDHVDSANQEEWDDFEARWRLGQDAETADRRLSEYVDGYRGELGFCYLVLRR